MSPSSTLLNQRSNQAQEFLLHSRLWPDSEVPESPGDFLYWGAADSFCFQRAFPGLTDTVEKVLVIFGEQ
jgi:hypothetical protein